MGRSRRSSRSRPGGTDDRRPLPPRPEAFTCYSRSDPPRKGLGGCPGRWVRTNTLDKTATIGSEGVAATEAKRKDLRELETFRSAPADVEVKLTAILKDWQDIRTKPVGQQRQLLRKLVPDRITLMPHVRGDRKWVDWHG